LPFHLRRHRRRSHEAVTVVEVSMVEVFTVAALTSRAEAFAVVASVAAASDPGLRPA
jgi:hypothetical protein